MMLSRKARRSWALEPDDDSCRSWTLDPEAARPLSVSSVRLSRWLAVGSASSVKLLRRLSPSSNSIMLVGRRGNTALSSCSASGSTCDCRTSDAVPNCIDCRNVCSRSVFGAVLDTTLQNTTGKKKNKEERGRKKKKKKKEKFGKDL